MKNSSRRAGGRVSPRRAVLCAVFILLTLFWSGFIFARSAKNAEESSGESSEVIEKLADVVKPGFSELPEAEKVEYIESLQFIVRKAAHFSAYALLGFLAGAAFAAAGFAPLCGLIYATVYAASDEIHQFFVPGRSCEVRDFLIDFSGAFIGLLLLWLIVRLIAKIAHKNQK